MPVMLPPGAVPRSAPPAAALFGLDQGQAPTPQSGGGVALNPGEMVLPPRPTTPPGYTPQWPTQPVAPQQPQYQPPQQQYAPQPYQAQPPAYSPQPPLQQQQPAPQLFYQPPAAQPAVLPAQPFAQPVLQQPPAPPAPAPQPNFQQFTMPPDASQGAAGLPYQFNDGLALGGRVGGQPAPQGAGPQPALGVPPAAQAPVGGVQLPAGAQHSAPSTALRDSLIQQGYQVGFYANDQQLLDDIGTSQQSLGQLRQMARLGWQAQQQTAAPLSNGQPSQPQPQQPAQTQLPAAPQKPPRPEWKREWDGMVRRDPATGRFVPTDAMVNPLVAERANELAAWERGRAEELVNEGLTKADLDSILAERMTTLQTQIRQDMEREQQEAEGQRQVTQFLQSNANVFFQVGTNGQPLVNPVTGQPLTTAVGQMAFAYGNQYAQQFEAAYGQPPLPQQVIEHVQLRLTADQAAGRLPMAPPPAAPQPQRTLDPQQLRDNLINQAVVRNQQVAMAAYVPNQQGTIATAAQQATMPQNPRVSFRDQLLQAAEAKGQIPQGYAHAYR